jgi:hypothetical protein
VWPLARTETAAIDPPSDLTASDPTPGVCC